MQSVFEPFIHHGVCISLVIDEVHVIAEVVCKGQALPIPILTYQHMHVSIQASIYESIVVDIEHMMAGFLSTCFLVK